MSTYVPKWLLDLHEQYVDDMLNSELAVSCQINYHPKMVACSNCVLNPIGNKSSNIHRTGGPVPFPINSTCPVCNGEGYQQQVNSDTINMQIYDNPADWKKIGINIQNPDGFLVAKGFMSDLPKLRKCMNIQINKNIEGYITGIFVLSGDAIAHGFRNNRYFLVKLSRI